MSDQDFTDVPDSNPWNTVPSQAPQPPEPVQPEPQDPTVPPVQPEPYMGEPVPEVVFTPEPEVVFTPEQPEPVIYDPVRDEHEPYVDVKPTSDGFEPAPPAPKSPTIPQPPEKKRMSGWVIALIVLLVLCICVLVPIIVVISLIASGQYTLEWSYLINSAMSML